MASRIYDGVLDGFWEIGGGTRRRRWKPRRAALHLRTRAGEPSREAGGNQRAVYYCWTGAGVYCRDIAGGTVEMDPRFGSGSGGDSRGIDVTHA